MKRQGFINKIQQAFKVNPAVALLGPRQCGKTTLAHDITTLVQKNGTSITYFDLEKSTHLAALNDPYLALNQEKGLVVIDEIQRKPDLFPTLRVLIDEQKRQTRYLILGSASKNLLRQSSESLAGRLSTLEVTPFSAEEIATPDIKKLWLKGGFPRSFLAKSQAISESWREEYIALFIERDIPNLDIKINPVQLRRFWAMLAHYHANIFNASELGKSMGLSHHTIRGYLDILVETYMVREIQPWFENLRKRQIKSPKIYFRDSGLYHSILNINENQLHHNPKIGASWEGFVIEQIIRREQAKPNEVYFWGTHNEAELDLLIFKGNKKIGYEIKFTDSPKLTPSMTIAMKDLSLDSLSVIFPGSSKKFSLAERVSAVGFDTWIKS